MTNTKPKNEKLEILKAFLNSFNESSIKEYIDKKIIQNKNEIITTNCKTCRKLFIYPIDYKEQFLYYDWKIPTCQKADLNCICHNDKYFMSKTLFLPKRCDCCFNEMLIEKKSKDEKRKIEHTYTCGCGISMFIKYKKNGRLWNDTIQKHEDDNYIHHLYLEDDTNTFTDIKEHLGFNLYIKTKPELKEFIKNRNIDIDINFKDTHKIILEKLINMFKEHKSFIKKKNNDYDTFNKLTVNELRCNIKEFKLKIPYYKKLSKHELILKIIEIQSI